MKKIFRFDEFQKGQMEAIIAYLNDKDTFVSMKTGREKSLYYAISAICFQDLTVVFSSFKMLIKN